MILRPKNWQSFQHYKDRSPAWIKLHRGLLNDFEFSRLPIASKALAPLLWVLASEYQDGAISASLDEIAFRIHVSRDELDAGLKPLIDAGFFSSDSDVAQCASTMLAAPEHDASEVVQNATLEKRREREEEEKNIPAVADAPRRDDKFDEFWASYPKRDGANPKEPAAKLFRAAVKAGEDPDAIIRGAKICAVKESSRIGTPYIPQAVKWLKDKRWRDYLDAAPAVEKAAAALKSMFYAAAESPQLAAWDEHYRATRGRPCARDPNGGWYFETEWPPGHAPTVPKETRSMAPPALAMRGF